MVKFIDYEYADYNYQAFDIGNHFNEFAGERLEITMVRRKQTSDCCFSVNVMRP